MLGYIPVEQRKGLVGSASLDQWKFKHKRMLPGKFYATDLDLLLVEKYPENHIVCAIDYKQSWDGITFTQVILFNWLLDEDIPVYVVQETDADTFSIYKYLGGDPKPEPPKVQLKLLHDGLGWAEFEAWQRTIRMVSQKRQKRKQEGRQLPLVARQIFKWNGWKV
jgi:hypothetical protein